MWVGDGNICNTRGRPGARILPARATGRRGWHPLDLSFVFLLPDLWVPTDVFVGNLSPNCPKVFFKLKHPVIY